MTTVHESNVQANKDAALRFFDTLLDGDPTRLDSLVDPGIKLNSWPFLAPGRDGITQMVELIATAFSNYKLTIEDVIAENDRVVVRLTETGVHTGPLLGMPASGNTFSNSMIHILRLDDGVVIEHWREVDMQKLMSQLTVDV